MKKINIKIFNGALLCSLVGMFALSALLMGCQTSELDEEEQAKVAKQKMADYFDELFELGLTNPDEAKTKLNGFTFEKLLADNDNLMSDNEIRLKRSLVEAGIRLGDEKKSVERKLSDGTLYDKYLLRNEMMLNSRAVLYDLPYRMRSGKHYEKLQSVVKALQQEIDGIIEKKIAALPQPSASLTDKRWYWSVPLTELGVVLNDGKGGYIMDGDLTSDFTLKKDWTVEATHFALLPIGAEDSGNIAWDTDGLWDSKNMAGKLNYYVDGNKILFVVPLKQTYNFVSRNGDLARTWYYEFTYKVEGDKLVLTQPRRAMFKDILQVSWAYTHPLYDTLESERYYREMVLVQK